jgi:hypothetical protein
MTILSLLLRFKNRQPTAGFGQVALHNVRENGIDVVLLPRI